MASEEKPLSHGYVDAKERRKHTEGIRCVAVSKSPTTTSSESWLVMFCRMTILLNSPAHQQRSPPAFHRFQCWTSFSSSCLLRLSLRCIVSTRTSLWARRGAQWCCSRLLNRELVPNLNSPFQPNPSFLSCPRFSVASTCPSKQSVKGNSSPIKWGNPSRPCYVISSSLQRVCQ